MKYVWCLEMLLVIIFILGVCMCDFVMLLLWMIGEVFEILIGILFNWIVLLNGGSMWFICKYFRDNWLRILGWFSVLWLIINLKLVGNIMDLDFDVNICRWNYLLKKKFGFKCFCKVIKWFKDDICIIYLEWWIYRYNFFFFLLCCFREVNLSIKLYF